MIWARDTFYPEGGGQVGDQGRISIGDDHLFVVQDTQRVNDCIYAHR